MCEKFKEGELLIRDATVNDMPAVVSMIQVKTYYFKDNSWKHKLLALNLVTIR